MPMFPKEGPAGPQGDQGPQGPAGAAGAGVVPGGAVGQVLAKATATDYDTHWIDAATGGGGASDATVVHRTGGLAEDIDGQKTFTAQVHINSNLYIVNASIVVDALGVFNNPSASVGHGVTIGDSLLIIPKDGSTTCVIQLWSAPGPTYAINFGFSVPGQTATSDLVYSTFAPSTWVEAFRSHIYSNLTGSHLHIPVSYSTRNGVTVVLTQFHTGEAVRILDWLGRLLTRFDHVGDMPFGRVSAGGYSRDVARISAGFADNVDAQYKGYIKINPIDVGGEREGIDVYSDGTKAIVALRNIPYAFPGAQAAGALTNDGAGNLTWAASGGGGGGASYGGPDVWTVPPATGWAWDNQGTAFVNHNTYGMYLGDTAANTGTDDNKVLYRAEPAVPYTIDAIVEADSVSNQHDTTFRFGLGWRNSADGTLTCLRITLDGINTQLACEQYRAPSAQTGSATTSDTIYINERRYYRLRVVRTAARRQAFVSLTGEAWYKVYDVAYNDYHTPDQIIVMLQLGYGALASGFNVSYWNQF